MSKHSVLIIKDQGPLVRSGCVPLDITQNLARTDNNSSSQMQIHSIAGLYKFLMKNIDDKSTEINVVDPTNSAYILPKLIKDVLKFKVPILEALKTLFLYRLPAVIVNGILISSGKTYFSEHTLEKIKSNLR